MSEATSNHESLPSSQGKPDSSEQQTRSTRSFTLPRSKILRGRTNFQRLFSSEAITLHTSSANFRFRVYSDKNEGCLVGFIVRKSLGTAVQRNRLKRQLREAYRLNQHLLTDLCEAADFGLHGAFLAKKQPLQSELIHRDVITLLTELRRYLENEGIIHP